MLILGMLFLFTIALFSIAYPLLGEPEEELAYTAGHSKELEKESIMSAINEIEFEYRMSKMNNEDYDELMTKYRGSALKILQEEDIQEVDVNAREKDKLMDEIERELQSLKEAKVLGS